MCQFMHVITSSKPEATDTEYVYNIYKTVNLHHNNLSSSFSNPLP